MTFAASTSTEQAKPEGMGWRVSVSIVTFFSLVIAVILWLSFYAQKFNVYQNVAVVIVILLAFIAVMGATWASWGMRQAFRTEQHNMSYVMSIGVCVIRRQTQGCCKRVANMLRSFFRVLPWH